MPHHTRWIAIVYLGIGLALAGCGGLAGEPVLLATLTPPLETPPAAGVTAPAATESVSAPAATEDVAQAAFIRTGPVTGQVLNGTAGMAAPGVLSVTLSSVGQDFAPESVRNLQGMTDAEGNFVFESVELTSDRVYFAVVRYRDRNFSSAPANAPAEGTLVLPVTVYELTEDPAVISLAETVIRVSPIPDGLSVLHSFTFRNTSDRLFTSAAAAGQGRFASVAVNLPVGALITGFDNEARYVDLTNTDVTTLDEPVVVDTLPVIPGTDHRILLSYLLPYEDGAIIEFPVNYATQGTVRVEIDNAAITLDSEQIVHSGSEVINDTPVEVYSGVVTLEPRDTIRFEIGGQLGTSGDRSLVTSDNLLPIFMAMVGVVLVLIVALFALQRRGSVTAVTRDQLVEGLVRQISELDRQHERGEINHDVYQQRRQLLKRQLAQVMDGEEQA